MSVNRRDFLKTAAATATLSLGGAARSARAEPTAGAKDDHYAMLNDSTRCVGCRACQAVCKREHGLGRAGSNALYDMPTDLNSNSLTLIQLHKGSEKGWTFVKKQCLHCSEASCVSVCPVGAFIKRDDGVVSYDPGKCIGCRYCQYACPFNVPTFEFDEAAPVIQKCDFCKDLRLAKGEAPWCATVCPAGAITFGRRGEMLAEAKARIAANPERYNPHVYGETEIGGTSVLYLAPKDVSFAQLGYPAYEETRPFSLQENIQHGIFKYWAPPIALYASLALIAYTTGKKQREEDSGKGEGEKP
jgi:formate dehydrogenase iron-sulfur subunit